MGSRVRERVKISEESAVQSSEDTNHARDTYETTHDEYDAEISVDDSSNEDVSPDEGDETEPNGGVLKHEDEWDEEGETELYDEVLTDEEESDEETKEESKEESKEVSKEESKQEYHVEQNAYDKDACREDEEYYKECYECCTHRLPGTICCKSCLERVKQRRKAQSLRAALLVMTEAQDTAWKLRSKAALLLHFKMMQEREPYLSGPREAIKIELSEEYNQEMKQLAELLVKMGAATLKAAWSLVRGSKECSQSEQEQSPHSVLTTLAEKQERLAMHLMNASSKKDSIHEALQEVVSVADQIDKIIKEVNIEEWLRGYTEEEKKLIMEGINFSNACKLCGK